MRRRVLTLLSAALFASSCASEPPAETPSPESFTIELWERTIGSDDPTLEGLTDSRLADLNNPATSPLDPEEFKEAAAAAGETIRVEVERRTPPNGWKNYWPDGLHRTAGALNEEVPACSDVEIAAANPQPLPNTMDVVKVVVVWSASACPEPVSDDPTARTVSYVYLERYEESWRPLRETQLPGAEALSVLAPAQLPTWALATLDCAADGVLYARVEVAAAWNELCAAAQDAGVELVAVDGLRSPADQERRFNDATEFFGSEEQAKRFVAEAERGKCASRHCAGEAIDYAPNLTAESWLGAAVACSSENGITDTAAGVCAEGTSPVPRSLQYGFAATLVHSPNHLDFVVPLAALPGSGCSPTAGSQALQLVATIWRCTLTQDGVEQETVAEIVASALLVADCTSNLDPAFASAGGVGLFGLPASLALAYVGPDADVFDPSYAAAAAAELWSAERRSGRSGWDPFTCRSALPEFGGPPLPEWSVLAAGL